MVTGAQPQHRDAVRMCALVANKTVPPVSVRATIEGPDANILHLQVPRSQSVIATSSGKILRRRLKANSEPETIPMYPYEIPTRLSELGRLDFSAQPITDATRDDFDPLERERLRKIVGAYGKSDKSLLELSDDELEQALRLTVEVGGVRVPTLTGMLLLGRVDALSRLVSTEEAVFQVLQGTDVRANVNYREPLLYTIESIAASIDPWNPVTEVQRGLFSEPVPAFDHQAVREALVNAFGHRDYSVLGRVRILIDDAGLTVSNPGGFVEGISTDNLLTADPHGRNPCLMDALKRIGLAERTGRGVDRIFQGSLVYGRPLPDYSASTSNLVSLFIARSVPDLAFIRLLADEEAKIGSPLSLQTLLVLDALKRDRRATFAELAGEIDVQAPQLKKILERLVEIGLLEARGSGGTRSFTLSSGVYKRVGRSKEYVRQTDIERIRYPELILKLAREQGRVTTSDVGALLHLDKGQAYYEIRKLMKSGRLEKRQGGPHAFYEPPEEEERP